MLRRFFSCALLLVFLSFAFAQSARAGTFYIKSVGTLDVSASGFNHLWYNSGNVTVTGSAAPGETVSVTVDGTAYSAVADAQGSWSHTLTPVPKASPLQTGRCRRMWTGLWKPPLPPSPAHSNIPSSYPGLPSS